ncbi:MAG: hypothetical protein V7731_01765 [Amphritea sp.]
MNHLLMKHRAARLQSFSMGGDGFEKIDNDPDRRGAKSHVFLNENTVLKAARAAVSVTKATTTTMKKVARQRSIAAEAALLELHQDSGSMIADDLKRSRRTVARLQSKGRRY